MSGERLGPYEIVASIGAGGMGEVYQAIDTRLNRMVALKLLPPDLARDPDRLRRFEEEARAASALNHPSIVVIYGAGQIDRQPYISMELVKGPTLREVLSTGSLPLRRVLQIGSELGDGLATAHDAGVVHRDLKPENIKVTADGFAKILDFGLAKQRPSGFDRTDDETTVAATRAGMVLGTVGYMSPEQASAQPVDHRSDQFSLGAVLYEMLTGSRAFDRPTAAECLSAIIREDPRPLSRLNPSVPPPVRWIVERCLAKQPRDRYTSTRDLARDLMSAREHLTELLAFARARRHGRAPGHVSLAVLPFASFSLQPAQALFAEAMTEAVIVELTHRDLLHVTSRMSSLVYRDQRRALPEIAAELAVGWIVQGSVMHHRKRLRVTAQLVHAATDENRWGRTFDCEASDLLTVQAEVAAAIADDIHGVVRREAETPLEEEPERFEVMA